MDGSPIVEEKSESTYKEKIQSIINNKKLNKEVKLNLISLIRDKNASKKNQEIYDNNNKNSQENQNNDRLHTGPEEKIAENDVPIDIAKGEKTLIDFDNSLDEYHDVDTTLNATKFNNTFKNAYDRLNPAEQTRSKSSKERSFLDLDKQEQYLEQKKKEKLQKQLKILRKKKKHDILKTKRKINTILPNTTPEKIEKIISINLTPNRPIDKQKVKDQKWTLYRQAKSRPPLYAKRNESN